MTKLTTTSRQPTSWCRSTSAGIDLSLWVFLALLSTAIGCATMRSGPATVPLRISSNVPDATVWIDDRLIAPVAELAKSEKRLVVGFHRIEVRAPGHYSHFAEVDVKPNQPLTLQAPLHPLLD